MQPALAAVHQAERRLMVRHIGVHGADDAKIVRKLADLLEHLAHLEAALAVFLNLNGDLKPAPVGRSVLSRFGSALPSNFVEHRLRIERIHLRRAAVHEEVDHALRLRLEVRLAHAKWIARIHRSLRAARADEIAKSQRAEAHADAVQQLAAGEKGVFEIGGVVGHGGLFAIEAVGGIALVVFDNENANSPGFDAVESVIWESFEVCPAVIVIGCGMKMLRIVRGFQQGGFKFSLKFNGKLGRYFAVVSGDFARVSYCCWMEPDVHGFAGSRTCVQNSSQLIS